MKRTLSLLLAIFIFVSSLLILSSCGRDDEEFDDNKPTVAVTIVPQATFVRAICGDSYNIVTMVPPGSSPETYDPSLKEMKRFSKADVYFTIGVPSETNILKSVSDKTEVIELHTLCAKKYDDLKIGTERDPHIWLSPKRVKIMAEAICDELCKLTPDNADKFRDGLDSFIQELNSADEYIRAKLDGIENRKFLVYHPSFGYFADEYNLDMFALEEEGKEATAKHKQEMIEIAKKNGIKIIFYQAENSGREAQSFAEDIGGEAVELEPLGADYINNIKKIADKIAGR